MKKILIFVMMLLLTESASAHKEWVHQYIVQEAYRFLEREVGEIPGIKNHLGLNYFGSGEGEKYPWELEEAISSGAWREDVYDAVWGYGSLIGGGADATITHFWDADKNDNDLTDFSPLIGDRENSWTKARNYFFGRNFRDSYKFFHDGKYAIQFPGYADARTQGLYRSYDNLCDFYTTGNSYIIGFQDVYNDAVYTVYNPPKQVTFYEGGRKTFALNIFGRILHLLADMGVPAHTHVDTHPCLFSNGDQYELTMGGNWQYGASYCNEPHQYCPANNWTRYTARDRGGLLLEVFSMPDEDAFRYMFYTMNQLANHFASRNENGNNVLANGGSSYVSSRYNALGNDYTVMCSDCFDSGDLANELMNYTIRVTATMMYWFAVKTGMVGCPETLYQQSHRYYGVRTAEENATFKASSKIIAGRSVHPNLTSSQGDVVVESGTLTYLAGDEIQLKNGFVAKAGCNFHAKIQNACPLSYTSCSLNYNNNSIISENFSKQNVSIGGEETIQSYGDSIAKYTISVYNTVTPIISGDTLYLSKWYRGQRVPRSGDTVPEFIKHFPIWVYTDSLVVVNENDSVLFTRNLFCSIMLTDSSATIILSDTTGTASNPGNDNTPRIQNIYPNPNSDYIDMQIDGRGSVATVTIYTQMGVKISETTAKTTDKLSRVYTSDLAPGMYMAVVKNANGVTSKNFVVNR